METKNRNSFFELFCNEQLTNRVIYRQEEESRESFFPFVVRNNYNLSADGNDPLWREMEIFRERRLQQYLTYNSQEIMSINLQGHFSPSISDITDKNKFII